MSKEKLQTCDPINGGKWLADNLRQALATFPAESTEERCQFYASFLGVISGQLIAEVGHKDAMAVIGGLAEAIGDFRPGSLH